MSFWCEANDINTLDRLLGNIMVKVLVLLQKKNSIWQDLTEFTATHNQFENCLGKNEWMTSQQLPLWPCNFMAILFNPETACLRECDINYLQPHELQWSRWVQIGGQALRSFREKEERKAFDFDSCPATHPITFDYPFKLILNNISIILCAASSFNILPFF